MTADTLTLLTGGNQITGWTSVSVSASIEQVPRSFQIALSGASSQDYRVEVDTGQPVQVLLGTSPVITGYVDDISSAISSRNHVKTISGSSKVQDLIQSQLALQGSSSQIQGKTLQQIAEQFAGTHGISVRMDPSDDKVIPTFRVSIGQTGFDVIEQVARYRQYLVYDDAEGNLVLTRTSTQRQAGTLEEGAVRILDASYRKNVSQRFNTYHVYWDPNQVWLQEVQPGIALRGSATDGDIRASRQFNIISNQMIDGQEMAQARAEWERNRRVGRSYTLTVRLTGWRDSGGELWAPNKLLSVKFPSLGLAQTDMLISRVQFNLSPASGTTTSLELMPPSAFSMEPASAPGQGSTVALREVAAAGTATP